MNNNSGMTLIVKTAARITFWLICLYGFYIAARAHSGPGSGFAAGVIIALSLVLLMLAFGKERITRKIDELKGLVLTSIGGMIFLIIAAGSFKAHTTPAIIELLADFVLALTVGIGLFVVFLALVLLAAEEKAP